MATKFFGIVTLVGLVLVLGACSLVQAVLPDQEFPVTDPIGLDGAVVTAAFIGSTSLSTEAVGGQQAGAPLQGPLPSVQVPEIDDSEFRGFTPVSLSADATLRATVEIYSVSATDPADFATTLTMTAAALGTITIDDGSSNAPVSFGPFATPAGVTLTLTKTDCVTAVGVTCSYEASATGVAEFAMAVVFTGGDLSGLWDVLTNGVTPNNLSGTLDLTMQGTVPSDVEVTVTLDAASGTIVF